MARRPEWHKPLDAPEIRLCEVCGATFTAEADVQKGCSQKCSARRNLLLKKYGMTPQEWRDMFADQGEACACCGTDLRDKRTCTDHDHETGRVRGILCTNCNSGLGKLGDQPHGLEQAHAYILSNRDLLGELLAA